MQVLPKLWYYTMWYPKYHNTLSLWSCFTDSEIDCPKIWFNASHSLSANIKDNSKVPLARMEFCEAVWKISSCSSHFDFSPGDHLFWRFVVFSAPPEVPYKSTATSLHIRSYSPSTVKLTRSSNCVVDKTALKYLNNELVSHQRSVFGVSDRRSASNMADPYLFSSVVRIN